MSIREYTPRKPVADDADPWDALRAESPPSPPASMRRQMQESLLGAFAGLPLQLAVDQAGIDNPTVDAWLALSAARVEPFRTWDVMLHQAAAQYVQRGMYAANCPTARMFSKRGQSMNARLRDRKGTLQRFRNPPKQPSKIHLEEAARANSERLRPQDLKQPTMGDLNPAWDARRLAHAGRPDWAADGVELLPHTAFEG